MVDYNIKKSDNDYERILEIIRKEAELYLVDSGLKSVVLGISGGIDSALVAAIIKPVCDKLEIPLIGRFISIEGNKEDEANRADKVGKYFCTDYDSIDLSDNFYEVKSFDKLDLLGPGDDTVSNLEKIRMGNIKARLRMMYLYNLAAKNQGLVLSTDNLTEYLLGFWTLHGDVGDFGLIQNLWKTEVYNLTRYIAMVELEHPGVDPTDSQMALYECITADATDGLGISNTDLDQILPDWRKRHTTTESGYAEVDDILFTTLYTKEEINRDHPVVKRMMATRFKRTNPYNLSRESILKFN